MPTRDVVATVIRPNGNVWSSAVVRYTLVRDVYTVTPDATYPIAIVEGITDSNGQLTVTLTANLASPYRVRMPDGEEFEVYLPYDSGAAISLETLRATYTGVAPSALVQLQGPTGPTGAVSTTPGPTGPASVIAGPTGPGGGRAGPGVVEFWRTFSTTTTDADPGNGVLRLNNATQNLSTQAFIDLQDTNAIVQTTLLDTLDDSTNTIKGHVRIEKQSAATSFLVCALTAVTTATGYRKLVFTVVDSSGANPFANADALYITFTRAGDAGTNGSNGAAGANGAPGGRMFTRTFSTTTTDADPGVGFVRFNNATQSSATQMFIDLQNIATVDQTTMLDALDDSTNTIKGTFRFEKQSDQSAWIDAAMSGSVTSATGYRKITFAVMGSSTSNPFANNDPLFISFSRAGDTGSTTITGGLKFEAGDFAGGVISTGTKKYFSVPYAMTITGWRLLLDQPSTTTLDVWKTAYPTIPTDANRIAGTEKPATSAAQVAEDTSLTTWTTAVSAGDLLGLEVEANNAARWFELTLKFTRTLP